MAVLVEGISVITRRDAIDTKYPGGWAAFVDAAPNATLCYDNELARIGFMHPQDVEHFINRLKQIGLSFLLDNKAKDIAIADQQRGLTTECDWLEFAKLPFGETGGRVSACWFFDGPRVSHGVHFHGESIQLVTPPGWMFEGSLSSRFGFVLTGQEEGRLTFLRSEDGTDVFLDQETGKEVYVGRTS